MPMRSFRTRIACILAASIVAAAGCSRADSVPRIRLGAPCAACGMAIRDTHFACVRGSGGRERQYDSIECLLRDGSPGEREPVYLPDYDQQRLCGADTVWVVQGSFPTPMGGGFAAFADERSAREIGARTHGRVGRLDRFVGRTRS